MKIILVSVGSRGDVEPFITIAEMLKEKGHQVMCLFPEQFRDLAEDSNIPFYGLSKKFIELIEGDDAKLLMGGKMSFFKKIKTYIKLYKQGVIVNKELVIEQHKIITQENPDRIVFNGKSSYPIIWGLKNPNKIILVSPIPCLIHYVKDHPHVGFKKNMGTFLNKLTYSLATYGFVQNILSTTKQFRGNTIKRKQVKTALLTTNTIYAISPIIFPKPNYWASNTSVLGYHERKKTSHWKADESLKSFLQRHDKVLFVTFGSMTNPNPEEKTKIILDILERNKIPAIINTASGGLVKLPNTDNNLIHFVDRIPYDWAFSKIYAVMHHGGSGTTHTALKYGCASMIIPHIIDQFLWNDLISDLGVGPKGVPVHNISIKKLEPLVLDLFKNNSYKEKALAIQTNFEKEDLTKALYNKIIQ
jgi:UDP:flavonoid glycosyltransferase YjiC (YdhE family)